GAAYLSGEPRQRQTGVGWASLRDLPPPAGAPTLTVGAVDAALQAMADTSGPGSQGRRRALVHDLFAAATADEQWMLRGLFSGELRQGAQAGLLVDAVGRAAEVDVTAVRRALLLAGDVTAVAAVRALPVRAVVLDGEAMGVAADGRPLPFQETSSRAARRTGGGPTTLRPYFFDLLHLDGADLLDAPASQRWSALGAAVPADLLVGRALVSTVD